MGYDSRDFMVRADRFKASGKWYETFALDMAGLYNEADLADSAVRTGRANQEFRAAICAEAVHAALNRSGVSAESGGFVVVLDPFHERSIPVVAWGRRDGTWGFQDRGFPDLTSEQPADSVDREEHGLTKTSNR